DASLPPRRALPPAAPRVRASGRAPGRRGPSGSADLEPSSLELQRLELEKFLEAVDAGLAAVARLLEAAEGRVHVEGAAVHVHLPGADAARDALRARVVPGPHRARQAVHRVVGDAHRVFLVLV